MSEWVCVCVCVGGWVGGGGGGGGGGGWGGGGGGGGRGGVNLKLIPVANPKYHMLQQVFSTLCIYQPCFTTTTSCQLSIHMAMPWTQGMSEVCQRYVNVRPCTKKVTFWKTAKCEGRFDIHNVSINHFYCGYIINHFQGVAAPPSLPVIPGFRARRYAITNTTGMVMVQTASKVAWV